MWRVKTGMSLTLLKTGSEIADDDEGIRLLIRVVGGKMRTLTLALFRL